MGCMSCNPFCGKCRPPHPKPVVCPSCGKLVMVGRYDAWVCPRCAGALPRRERLRCNWTGLWCDIPCMYNIRDNETGELHPCRWPDADHLHKEG